MPSRNVQWFLTLFRPKSIKGFEHTDRLHEVDTQLNNRSKKSIVYKLHPVLFTAEAFAPYVDYSSAHIFGRNQHH